MRVRQMVSSDFAARESVSSFCLAMVPSLCPRVQGVLDLRSTAGSWRHLTWIKGPPPSFRDVRDIWNQLGAPPVGTWMANTIMLDYDELFDPRGLLRSVPRYAAHFTRAIWPTWPRVAVR